MSRRNLDVELLPDWTTKCGKVHSTQFLYRSKKISIVTPKPQTTRNRINGILHTDQCQIVFLDTPGIHKSNQTLNRFLVETAWQALSGTDVVLLMIDGSRYIDKLSLLEKEISPLIKPIKNHLDKTIIAINKIDKIKKTKINFYL